MKDQKSPSMEEILGFAGSLDSEMSKHAFSAAMYFLYKETLENKLLIIEATQKDNKAAMKHIENQINDINIKLMDLMQKK